MAEGFGRGPAGGRLAVVALHDPRMGGASIAVLRAVPELERAGWRLAFWVPAPGAAYDWLRERGAQVGGAERPVAAGLRSLREPPGPLRNLSALRRYVRAFRAFIDEVGGDVVHSNSLFSFAEAIGARRAGHPTLLHVHDMAPAGLSGGVARWICRRGVDEAIAVSESCAASYSAGGWKPGVVFESATIPATPVSIRDRPEPFVIGTVGVVAPRKGSDVFVGAARALAERGVPIELRMIGSASDPLEREWGQAVIADAKAAGIAHLPEADVEAEMRTWDALALPSRSDPCPLVMLEAMALGLPVIGARTDGIAEQVRPENGILIEPGDAGALAGAMRDLAALPAGDRAAMGAAGRARVAAEFSVERQAAGIAAAYERTIARHASH